MVYVPQTWADGDPDRPVSAARLNYIENGIAANAGVVAATPNAVAQRTPTGALKVGTPVDDDDAARLGDLATLAPQAVAQDGALPTFTRLNGGAPVFTAATQNPAPDAASPLWAGSIYWPCILDARAALGESALGEYYLYYSTDHAPTGDAGGIWLATGPTALGPWLGRGRVYVDTVSGTQTETATVYPDPTGATGFVMLYQQSGVSGAVGIQTTCYATSPDGITWTRGGIAIDVTASTPGDGHTGYANSVRVGSMVYSHHLRGGGDRPHFGLSVSSDGRRFQPVHMLGYGRDQTGDGRRIEWNSGWVVRWRGSLIWVGLTSDFSSGGTPKDARIVAAPITEDLQHLIGTPRHQLYPTSGSETTNYRSTYTFVDRDGSLILYYQSGTAFYAAKGQ